MIAVGSGRILIAYILEGESNNLGQAILLEAASEVINAMVIMTVVSIVATKVVTRLTDTMERLASGDLDVEVAGQGRSDEFGNMARALQVFKETAIEAEKMRAAQETERYENEKRLRDEMLKLSDDLDKAVQSTVSSVVHRSQQMSGLAKQMHQSVDSMRNTSETAAQATEATGRNVGNVTEVAGELAAASQQIGRQVGNSTKIAQEAVSEVDHANNTVAGLADAVTQIGSVVELINEIAGQTNLLALNATIEAARAGDAGKGFAVVANEVKSLANQTAKATDEISQHIGKVQNETSQAVQAIKGIHKTIAEIDEIARDVAKSVSRQSEDIEKVSSNVTEAGQATQSVSREMQSLSDQAGQANDMSVQVSESADSVSAEVQNLQDQLMRTLRNSVAGNRRNHPRKQVRLRTNVSSGNGKVDVDLLDVSIGGMELSSLPGLVAGDQIQVDLPDGDTLPARIVRNAGDRMGIEFDISPDEQERVRSLFSL